MPNGKNRDYQQEQSQQQGRRQRYKDAGRCQCGRERLLTDKKLCTTCRDRTNEDTRRRVVMRKAAGLCVTCGNPREGKVRCDRCGVQHKEYRLAFKLQVMTEYGGACQCCGEKELAFLSIDHINGGGSNHRKEVGNGGHALYYWLKKHGYPKDGYRVLCFNCNAGRQVNGGVCPHEQRRPKAKPAKSRSAKPPCLKPTLF